MDTTMNNESPSPITHQSSEIQKFYKDCNIFVTGGTGFMAKMLIEKLFRCTEVSTIYLLVREKKGKNVQARIDEITQEAVFEKLNSQFSNYKHKIIGVLGDCSQPDMGLSKADREKLIRNVDVVFHMAATVNLNENLKKAFTINVKGTESIICLCKEIVNLKALVHVSTAYSNCHLKEIDEKFYDYPVNYKDVQLALDKLDDASVYSSTPQFIGNWPNTYTFTKALAEDVVQETAINLPVGVFRPTVITSTYKEPIPGWIDNTYGPTGGCIIVATGILRVLFSKTDTYANIVPADTCISALLAVAWDIHRKRNTSPINIPIYNYVSTCENPITWNEYMRTTMMYIKEYPTSKAMWCSKLTVTSNILKYMLMKFFYHYLPAILLDGLMLMTAKKPKALKIYKKAHKYDDLTSHFRTRIWYFSNQNMKTLWNNMNESDRELFPFSLSMLNWFVYLRNCIIGIRLYLLKDPMNTLEKAKIKQERFRILHKVLKYSFVTVALHLIWECVYQLIY